MTWDAVADADGYRIDPIVLPSRTALPPMLTRKPSLPQSSVAVGAYEYSFAPEYDVANWPDVGQTLKLFGPIGGKYGFTMSAGSTQY